MKININLNLFIRLLLWLETGQWCADPIYPNLKELFLQARTKARQEDPLPQKLCGVTVSDLRAYLSGYYGRPGANEADAEQLMRLNYDDWCRLLDWTIWSPLECNRMPFESMALAVADMALEQGAELTARTLQELLNGLLSLDKRRRPLKPVEVTGEMDKPTLHLLRFAANNSVRADIIVNGLLKKRRDLLQEAMEEEWIGPVEAEKRLNRYLKLVDILLMNEQEEEEKNYP